MLDKTRIESQLLKFFSLLAILNIMVFGLISYTVDSELWAVMMAKFFGHSDPSSLSVYNKPLYYALLKPLYFLPLSNLEHVVAAKCLFVLNGLALCAIAFQLFRRITVNRVSARVGFLFLLLHPTWIVECFRIRSDLLAMNFSLLALVAFWSTWKRRFLWIFICLILSFLSTPKAIVWNFPLLILFAGDLRLNFSKRNILLGLIGIGSAFGLAVAGHFLLPFVQSAYELAWRHFNEMMMLYSANGVWGQAPDWMFVLNSIYAMPVLWFLVIGSILVLPWTIRSWPRRRKIAMIAYYVVQIIFFLLYSPKLAFFWAALLPVLMLPGVLLLDQFYWKMKWPWRIGLVSWLFAFGCYRAVDIYTEQNGFDNYQFISDMNRFVESSNPDLRIFDSMGLLPRSSTVIAYAGAGDAEGTAAGRNEVLADPPDLVFETARIRILMPGLGAELLETQYQEIQEGIWLRKKSFPVMPKSISNVGGLPELFNQRLFYW